MSAASRMLSVCAAGLGLALGPAAEATLIGVNFVGKYHKDPSENQPFEGDPAGVFLLSHWNNAVGGSGEIADLVDDQGSTTMAAVSWCGGISYTGIANTTADRRLMRGYLSALGDSGPTADVSGLASLFPHGYDVIAYFDGDNVGETWEMDFTIGLWTVTGRDLAGTDFSGTFTEDTGSGGNCVRFRGLGGDGFSLTVAAISGAGETPALNALQIVAVPEPATLGLVTLGLAGLALRRGKKA